MTTSYVGRIVAGGWSQAGNPALLYRVSSRSFPNRTAVQKGEEVSIVPKEGYEKDIFRNPYIAYNCLKIVNPRFAVISNGSHTDPLGYKLMKGGNPRDILGEVLLAMDYEHDQLQTPRIAGIIDQKEEKLYLGIIREDALLIRCWSKRNGVIYYVATYEHNEPSDQQIDRLFDCQNAKEGCDYILGKGIFQNFTNPVTAVCAYFDHSWQIAIQNAGGNS